MTSRDNQYIDPNIIQEDSPMEVTEPQYQYQLDQLQPEVIHMEATENPLPGIRITSDQDTILVRYNHDLHYGMKEHFTTDIGKQHIVGLINNQVPLDTGSVHATRIETPYRNRDITMNDLYREPIRIASFLVYSDDLETKFKLIPTIYQSEFICINLIGNDPAIIRANHEIIELLKNRIHTELILLNGRGTFIVSFDIYYNRLLAQSGQFHRDIGTGVGNTPNYVSLEYFAESDRPFFGPEALLNPRQPNEPAVFTNLDRNQTSMRLLVRDGIVIIFNNFNLVHATPIISSSDQDNMFSRQIHRSEIQPRDQHLVNNTLERRTFLRSWIQELQVEQPIQELFSVNNGVLSKAPYFDRLQGEVETLPLDNNFQNDLINPEIHGGSSHNPESSHPEIFQFRLVGNPLKSPITVDADNFFQEIKKSKIKDHIKNEKRMLKSIAPNKIKRRNNHRISKYRVYSKRRQQNKVNSKKKRLNNTTRRRQTMPFLNY
jgi:hypothetical protein